MDKKYLQHSILETAYDSKQWRSVMVEYFGVRSFLLQPKPVSLPTNDFADAAFELGNFHTADERLVGIYEVKLNPKAWIERNRIGLRSLLRHVYKYDVDAALIVFVQADKWRFSYVSEIRNDEGKMETEPKRYTYLFGKGEISRTATDRFEKLKGKPVYLNDLFEAFNVEKLNKDFFKTYKEFYLRGVAEIIERNPFCKLLMDKTQEDKEKKEKPIRDFVKKMLGRIVFLHFLQKKGWMGVDANNMAWDGGDIKFLQNLFANQKHKEKFLTTALRTLFFETLNTKRKNDLAPTSLGAEIKLPYLNGGLFDKDNSFYNDIDFTADYFKNLLEFFEQYNFTIDENDPYDNEVGIDPEMLGHIFENLLEENKDKGAFYTPKEVVHYMCQESLIQYLRTHLPECTEDESSATISLQNFIRNGVIGERTDKKNFVVQQAKRIEKLLDCVKICDPAIGSGAFPMGMLQEIYKAKTNLDLTLDHTEVKKQIIQNCIYGVDIENGAVEIARLRFWLALVVDETTPHPLPNLDYKIMQGNSLLESFEGVDLSNLADMEKEETFPSASNHQLELGADFSLKKQRMLVFDQKSKNQLYELINDYYNYDETANTKYKSKQFIKDEINRIVEGKLIARFYLQKPKEEQKINDTQNALKSIRLTVADAPGHRAKKEKKIEKLIHELEIEDAELEKLSNIIERLHELQTRTDKPYFLWHLWFKDVFDKGGFDIVIGNPPYIQLQKLNTYANKLEAEGFETFSRRGDIYCLFYEHGIKLLKNKGLIVFITSNSWLKAKYGESLRKYFVEKTNPIKLLNFEDAQIFSTAIVETSILVAKKMKWDKSLKAISVKNDYISGASIDKYIESRFVIIKELSSDGWAILSEFQNEIKNKIKKQGKLLKNFDITINFGIKTGLNEAFILDEEERKSIIQFQKESEQIIKPILRGRDLTRFYFSFNKKWIIVSPFKQHKIIEEHYIAIVNHLKKFEDKLKLRGQVQNGQHHWLELDNNPTEKYFALFNEPRIIWGELSDRPKFAYDEEGFYAEATLFFMLGEHLKFILAVLNSRLSEWYFNQISPTSGMGTNRWKKYMIEQLPVPEPKENHEIIFNSLVEKVISIKKQKLDSGNFENKIDALVFHLYNLTEIEMLQVLDTFKDMSIKDRNQIQNEYWNIANNKFKTEA